jgi:cbb3-type cytochrome oxidase maturation protein
MMTRIIFPEEASLYLGPMSVLFVLFGCSICIALAFLFFFLWAVRSGQYDDTCTPAVRILFDDGAKSSADNPDQGGNP